MLFTQAVSGIMCCSHWQRQASCAVHTGSVRYHVLFTQAVSGVMFIGQHLKTASRVKRTPCLFHRGKRPISGQMTPKIPWTMECFGRGPIFREAVSPADTRASVSQTSAVIHRFLPGDEYANHIPNPLHKPRYTKVKVLPTQDKHCTS